jgi:HD-GYP domain-containing protein (c-di-GMP phosphodiesterase class II)
MIACDHSAPHSGVARYQRGSARLRLTLVCDRCGTEQGELGSIEYRPNARRMGLELAEATARELGLHDHKVQRLRLAAMICDVGRDQIPAAILDKRGPLTDDELVQVRRQPELGAAMLSAPSLGDVREWILSRRERPDGSGYPRGLSGDEIALEARILGVVEAYVAMVSDRPHRPAMHRALALRELLDNAGSQFDAAVVTAFIRARPREPVPPRSGTRSRRQPPPESGDGWPRRTPPHARAA